MQVTITFTATDEDDGFEGSTIVVRDGIEDLYGLGKAYADAARAGGYTYVQDVAFEKDNGEMVFGGF